MSGVVLMLSGCRALKGCERKDSCARYQRFLHSTAYEGFSATQTCRVSAFVKNEYPHFVPIHEENPMSISWDYEEDATTPYYHVYAVDGPMDDEENLVSIILDIPRTHENDRDLQSVVDALKAIEARMKEEKRYEQQHYC